MKSKRKITTLFLDIGGVLLSNGWGYGFRQKAIAEFQLDKAEIEERHSLMFVTYEEGRISLKEYLDKVIFYKERDFTFNEFRDFMFSLTTPDWEMLALIKNIKRQYGLKIIAVSNEARELNTYRINTFKLNDIVDFFISSCYVHLRKPDPAIFRLAIEGAQVPLDEIVFIDDVEMFAKVAKDMGITSIQHTDCLSTSKALADLGLIIKQEKIEYA